jgi:hydroxylamine dehydrogenase
MTYLSSCFYASPVIAVFLFIAGTLGLTGCATQREGGSLALQVNTPVEREKGITDESLKCITCHEQKGISHGWIADWEGSRHARKGIGCEACHVNLSQEQTSAEGVELEYFDIDRSRCEDKRVNRQVSASFCGKCHIKQYNEFIHSRHSLSWNRVIECSKYAGFTKEVRLTKCAPCHNIQYKCDSCHTRHYFNVLEAKTPEACRTCHSGPDHPHYESFISSKHGAVYTASQSDILKESQTTRALRSPVCVTCHMPQGSHDLSFGLAYGPTGTGASYINRDGVTVDNTELARRREMMLTVCDACHSRHFSGKTLAAADGIHKNAEGVIHEAKELISGLEKDGLVTPPLSGLTDSQFVGHPLVLGDVQLFNEKSRVYSLFFNLTNSALIAWKGAYHMNPNYTHLYGWNELQKNLGELKEEARRLRDDAELKRKMSIKLK